MKKFLIGISCLLLSLSLNAQQLPNSNFEDWSGATYDGEIQPKSWNASHVTQVGLKFNFAHRESGHNGGYSMMVQDQSVGAAGITETSPGYFALGQPWAYLPSILEVNKATAGTSGGISWTYRPDTMSVWIRRIGDDWSKEDFYLLYYSWKGTAKSNKYKGKNGNCTSHDETDEESDIRQAMNGNECGTTQKATQIAEGMWRERKQYTNWVNIRVPIYYMSNDVPEKVNVIFSASNYPNFRANSGLYVGNSLYVDDIELIYSNKIQSLYIDNVQWNGFDPDSEEEQIFSLGENATTLPSIEAYRGAGSLTNARGTTKAFPGRKLDSSDMTITPGVIDGAPTLITVTSGDGQSTRTYKIKFVRAASTNSKLAGIQVNGTAVQGFTSSVTSYDVALPYGTTEVPTIEVTAQEPTQQVTITQSTSVTGRATIEVTAAAGGNNKTTYTLQFRVAPLSDNTLQDIQICVKETASDPEVYTSIPGFTPTQTTYRVSIPAGTTIMPLVRAVSAYPDGEQTIVHKAPTKIDGGSYTLSVTTPGDPIAKVYKLNFKEEQSSYSLLKSLSMDGGWIQDFAPDQLVYYVNLPLGTATLPAITYEAGDRYQTVTIEDGGLDGTTRVVVRAANGDQTVYKIIVSTEKSTRSDLQMIYVGGEPLAGFSPDITNYDAIELPVGTTTLPSITYDKGDELETVNVMPGGPNGTTRISVLAQDGSATIYQMTFYVKQATNATLSMIYVGGEPLIGFSADVLEYDYLLPKGTTELPVVTYDRADEFQTIVARGGGVNGDYKLIVRPQSGASQTYVIHFHVEVSSNVGLTAITIGGEPLAGFIPEVTDYEVTLPAGVSTIPAVVAYGDASQRILTVQDGSMVRITVTAEDGTKRVYAIAFEIPKSENAFLQMIYLDGQPLANFESSTLGYTHTIATDALCPKITVQRMDSAQQVTITTPYADGTAKIRVTPESGAPNEYTITIVRMADESVLLAGIQLDGADLPNFDPTTMSYGDLEYQGALPVVTAVTRVGQTARVMTSGEEVRIYVSAGKQTAMYILSFTAVHDSDATLRAIYADGILIDGFMPEQTTYTYTLAAGSSIPTLTYEKQNDKQVVVFGKTDEQTYRATVMPEDGSDVKEYSVIYTIAKYDNANLVNLSLKDKELVFDPNTYTYNIQLSRGEALPAISVIGAEGQTIVVTDVNENKQEVKVTAESGRVNTYVIDYTRVISDNALLSDILIDGVSLEGFDPMVYNYVDTLAWRTKTVPVVNAISELSTQTITTYFSGVNGVTVIDVMAEDNVSHARYTIAFPVRKSSNTLLDEIFIDDSSIEFEFNPNTTDYEIIMPYQSTHVPAVIYEKVEDEQIVEFISRPLGQVTQLIVTAENGDTRTYNLHFRAELATEANRLRTLGVYMNGSDILNELSLSDKNKRNFEVSMPYGSRSLQIAYEKMYAEQTVFVQPGGINHPTIITVKANKEGVDDEVYTITPTIATQNPAVLSGIKVNDVPIENFDMNQFSYIVQIDANPIVLPTGYNGAICTPTIVNSKHWQAIVSKDGFTNTYDLWFYYPGDVVPNTEFNEWTTAANNGAPKPAGWNCLADYFTSYSAFMSGSHTFGKNSEVVEETVSGSNKAVQLNSKKSAGSATSSLYGGALGGILPAWITLGTITGSLQVAGGSTFSAQGGITFRNSPDVMTVRAKTGSISNEKNRIVYQLSGSGSKELAFTTEANTGYKEYKFSLAEANNAVSAPMQLNIILNSFFKESMSTLTDGGDANMSIDYLRFSYNHTLTGLKVDALTATKSGNAFTATLTDPERVEIPLLSFVGEVEDQARKIVWADETQDGEYGVRTATIRNWAENGTDYTDYTLTVKRPLDTRNTLAGIRIGGSDLAAFVGTQNDYEYHMSSSVKQLPDFECVATSSLQTIATSFADSTMTIVVTPEIGETRTYTVKFITDLSDDASLSFISDVENFDAENTEYIIHSDKLPELKFTKKMDGQTVQSKNGTIIVTAENGNSRTYKVQLVCPTIVTTAQLDELEIDGHALSGFNPDIYTYEAERPLWMRFERQNYQDSVVYIQKPDGLEWQVYGTSQHTYKLNYPIDLSDNNLLKAIIVDGDTLSDYDPQMHEYEFFTNESEHIFYALPMMEKQQVQTTVYTDSIVEIEVTPENNGAKGIYRVALKRLLSSNDKLATILLDGVALEGFDAEVTDYHITIPVGQIKQAEPRLPSLTYQAEDSRAKVEVIAATSLGQTSYIDVSSEDGLYHRQYSVTVDAEPSHNADLKAILVNNMPVDKFEVGRHNYSVTTPSDEIVIGWASDDYFQNVQVNREETSYGYDYTLHVVAQDGVTMQDYVVEAIMLTQSDDATLKNILLGGVTFDDFERRINDRLHFSPMQNLYTINLPAGTTTLPEVSAQLMMEGQTVDIEMNDLEVLLHVTAKDGVTTNTYTLQFAVPTSNYADLSMIFIGTDSLENFRSDYYFYNVTLPVGTYTIPDVTPQKGESVQQIDTIIIDEPSRKVEIHVLAEDHRTTATYVLLFNFTLSSVKTLGAIYADGDTLTGYEPNRNNYYIQLPVGTPAFPQLSTSEDDNNTFPKVSIETLDSTTYRRSQLIHVLAEDSTSGLYKVVFEIKQSTVDTLKSIWVNNKEIESFRGDSMRYEVMLPSGTTTMPEVYPVLGDQYQKLDATWVPTSVTNKSLGWDIQIVVTSQSGSTRVYTIAFPMELSSDSLLNRICIDGKDLRSFEEGTFKYTETLVNDSITPVVSVFKKEDAQTYELFVTDSLGGKCVTIHVTAEDGLHHSTYVIFFRHEVDEHAEELNANLKAIYLNGEVLTDFHTDNLDYEVTLPVGTKTLPVITVDKYLEQQTYTVDVISGAPRYDSIVNIYVQAVGDNSDVVEETYSIRFTITRSSDATLSAIIVRGMALEEFSADVHEYTKLYPLGSVEGDFFHALDVKVTTTFAAASYTIMEDEDSNITITVTAEDGVTREAYVLHQAIEQSAENRLEMIYVVNAEDRTKQTEFFDFDPEVSFYTYTLMVGDVPPTLNFVPMDTTAVISRTPANANDTMIVTVIAANGDKRVYQIFFPETKVDDAAQPQANDVLVKCMGNGVIRVATTRKDVTFFLYNGSGMVTNYVKVPTCDPNDAQVSVDQNGQEKLFDVRGESGMDIQLVPGRVYIYGFYETEKRIISTGRLLVL